MSELCIFCNIKIHNNDKCNFCKYFLDIIYEKKSYNIWKCRNCRCINKNCNSKCFLCNIDKYNEKKFIIKKWFCTNCDTDNIYNDTITICSKCNYNNKLNIFRQYMRENVLETKIKNKLKHYEDEIKKLDNELYIYSLKKEMWELNDTSPKLSYNNIDNIWEYKKKQSDIIYTTNNSIFNELDYEFEKQANYDISHFYKLYTKKICIFDIDKWFPEEIEYYNTIFHDNLLTNIRNIDTNLVASFIKHNELLVDKIFSNSNLNIELNISIHNIKTLKKSLNDAYYYYKLYLKSIQ